MTTVLEEIEQQQTQEQKYLTIDDIIPKWSHLLDLLNTDHLDYEAIRDWEMTHGLDMGEHAKCAVGEAHKFDDDYHTTNEEHPKHCIGCELYAGSTFPRLYDTVTTRKLVGLDWRRVEGVKNFVRHWNTHHSEVTNKN